MSARMMKVILPTFVSISRPLAKCRVRRTIRPLKIPMPLLFVLFLTVLPTLTASTIFRGKLLSWRKKQIRESSRRRKWQMLSSKATWSRSKADVQSKCRKRLSVLRLMGRGCRERLRYIKTVSVISPLVLRKLVSFGCQQVQSFDG